jgi:hypothetical protein
MNMTFTRTDRRRSQLSIEPTRSQIGCVDQKLSQLGGYAEIYIRRNDQVLSAQIGMQTDRTGAWKASQISQVWTASRSKEVLAPSCHEHDIYSNGSVKIAAINRAYPQPNWMRGSRAIPVARICRDLHPQKQPSPKCPDRCVDRQNRCPESIPI